MTDIVAKTLAASYDEIEELWLHPVVKDLVAGNRLRLDECAAFFLDNIRRIAQADYSPTTDDILHVRLQTLGVIEYSFEISMAGVQYHWLLYDVGGARGQRQAWVPYFEGGKLSFITPSACRLPWASPAAYGHHQHSCIPACSISASACTCAVAAASLLLPLADRRLPTTIIFLAPISAFNQYLEEDPRTNRIDDSLQLFTTICSNKLLQKATLVLV
ncbi:guanine nucleotide binding protein, alpha subunit [Amylocystis lapponica]|nr:guanine nucleotide binding protein, alpha subunit [Amylocystis lapponica]